MEPMLELRNYIKETQEPARRLETRSLKRRSGRMKLVDEAMREKFTKNMEEAGIKAGDPAAKLIPGPYTYGFRRQLLEKLLNVQEEVRRNGPDPGLTLIRDEEIHEIQRLWRVEGGDWRNSAYAIYKRVTGTELEAPRDELGGFGALEQEAIEAICKRRGVPELLVSRLLNAEHECQGARSHSAIYRRINSILGEEWREDLGEIVAELEKGPGAAGR